MDLSKAFDCISHDLVIAKLAAYGFDKSIICYIYSYLKNRKQCVSVNSIKRTFEEIISGVPQGWIVGSILFNIFLDDFFYFILVAWAHNSADDNALSSFAKTIKNLIDILESKSEIAMIVSPGKFQMIIFDKHKGNHTNQTINIDHKEIKAISKVKLLGIEIDDKLNFNHHINSICKSPSNQLNALIRLKHLLGFEDKNVLVNTFLMSNFNYFSLVNKIENLQKRVLCFLLNNYDSTYEDLLEKSGYPNMNLKMNSRVRWPDSF